MFLVEKQYYLLRFYHCYPVIVYLLQEPLYSLGYAEAWFGRLSGDKSARIIVHVGLCHDKTADFLR